MTVDVQHISPYIYTHIPKISFNQRDLPFCLQYSSMTSITNNARQQLPYKELVAQIKEWNVEFRLKEKYHTWKLKYSLPKVPTSFYQLVQHSLAGYVLGNLKWLVVASEEEVNVQLAGMKTAYSKMSLGSSISSEIFNFWMVLLVKVTAYFLSNHVAAVLVDTALECDIYRHTMLHVLGIQIEKNTYRILLRMFGCKREASKERQSIKLAQKEGEKSREDQKENEAKLRTIQSIGRRNGKHETTFFSNISTFNEQRSRLQEIKYLLKSNLYVKPIPKKVQQKYSIGQLKQQGHKQYSSLQSQARATPTGKFTIQANQLSHAFSSNFALRLNDIKNHSIHCSHNKNIARPQPPKRQSKKLEIKREEERPQDQRKGNKLAKNWVKIVTEMKEEIYQHKGSRLSEETGPEAHREDRQYLLDMEVVEKAKEEQERKQKQPTEEIFRFRKLNLMNSPNIIVYEDFPIDLNEDEQHNDLKSLKMNRSRLQRAEKRRNNLHPIENRQD